MGVIDTAMLLIICYVFGMLTAALLYLLIVSPVQKAAIRRAYMNGYYDALEHEGEK